MLATREQWSIGETTAVHVRVRGHAWCDSRCISHSSVLVGRRNLSLVEMRRSTKELCARGDGML